MLNWLLSLGVPSPPLMLFLQQGREVWGLASEGDLDSAGGHVNWDRTAVGRDVHVILPAAVAADTWAWQLWDTGSFYAKSSVMLLSDLSLKAQNMCSPSPGSEGVPPSCFPALLMMVEGLLLEMSMIVDFCLDPGTDIKRFACDHISWQEQSWTLDIDKAFKKLNWYARVPHPRPKTQGLTHGRQAFYG
jgi:hypothetical protein